MKSFSFGVFLGVVIVIGLFLWVSNMDYEDQRAMQDFAAGQATMREAAHRKADRLREEGLLDDANKLGYPVAHLPLDDTPRK